MLVSVGLVLVVMDGFFIALSWRVNEEHVVGCKLGTHPYPLPPRPTAQLPIPAPPPIAPHLLGRHELRGSIPQPSSPFAFPFLLLFIPYLLFLVSSYPYLLIYSVQILFLLLLRLARAFLIPLRCFSNFLFLNLVFALTYFLLQ